MRNRCRVMKSVSQQLDSKEPLYAHIKLNEYKFSIAVPCK